MTAVAAPRLTGGVVASVVLHGALIAAFLFLHAPEPPPSPPMYRVQLFAAPPGERAVGVVQEDGGMDDLTRSKLSARTGAARTDAVSDRD